MSHPDISVLMPIYNGERYLAAAIDSVLAQTYSQWELVLVNDGSSDSSARIAQSYASRDSRVRYFEQSNRGLPAALNAGLIKSTGTYIAALAQDDQWLPGYMEKMIAVMETNPRAGVAYSLAQMMDADGNNLPQVFGQAIRPEDIYDHLVEGNFIPACAAMIRRSALDSVGKYDENLYFEDWDLWLRVATVYPIVSLPELLIRYRVHGSNMTIQFEKMKEAKFAVVRKHFGEEDGNESAWSVEKLRAYAGVYYRSAINYVSVGETRQGISYLKRAFTLFPQWSRRRAPYYEIACAHQPLGERGNPDTLKLDEAARAVETILTGLFNDAPKIDSLLREQRAICALAYQVLGELCLAKGEMGAARNFVAKSFQQDTSRLADIGYVKTALRAMHLHSGRRVSPHNANSLS